MQDDSSRSGLEVAITGMIGRFPGAGGVDEFWQNLKNGRLSATFFSHEELRRAGVETGVLTSDNYVAARGILEDIENFDAYFFGYSPLEAELLDPQIRLFYEICWEALEDAGCDPTIFPGTIGVYAGATSNRWWQVLAVVRWYRERAISWANTRRNTCLTRIF
jgi:acyl transferase domain-containing protein